MKNIIAVLQTLNFGHLIYHQKQQSAQYIEMKKVLNNVIKHGTKPFKRGLIHSLEVDHEECSKQYSRIQKNKLKKDLYAL